MIFKLTTYSMLLLFLSTLAHSPAHALPGELPLPISVQIRLERVAIHDKDGTVQREPPIPFSILGTGSIRRAFDVGGIRPE